MNSNNLKIEIPRWWSRRRLLYNKGLFIYLLIALALYFFLGSKMIDGFEVSVHAVLVRLAYGLVYIVLANIFYTIGAMVDTRINWGGIERLSFLIWRIVYWVSALIPFVMPLVIVADKYDLYSPLEM